MRARGTAGRERARGEPLLVGASLVHAATLALLPLAPRPAAALLLGLGLWWNANTVAHNFLHRPFFRAPAANRLFSAWLTLLLGFPQELWRRRHLAHHAGRRARPRPDRRLLEELALTAAQHAALAIFAAPFYVAVCVPGFLLGQALCALQGRYEHLGATTSHHGRLYNLLFFNDGFHVEHHAAPGARWTELPGLAREGTRVSRWPAVLRWLEGGGLDRLERLALRSRLLQGFLLATHRRAMQRLLADRSDVCTVVVVGGGLFPRSATILLELFPDADIEVWDADPEHLAVGRARLGERVRWREAWFDPRAPLAADLVVVPLAFRGDRAALYALPPARDVLVHDWLFRPAGVGCRVSFLLLKRLNLVRREALPSVEEGALLRTT